MEDSKIFITGANGQLGTALRAKYPNAKYADIDNLDISDIESVENFDWSEIKIIINAAAYTNVDGAETAEGRKVAWAVNASAVSNLAKIASKNDILLVHISTEYVFDGSEKIHNEGEQYSPLSVYGSTKSAGDIAVSQISKFYILRITWLIGEGNNFVRTMINLAEKNISPVVVGDQVGRLTFTSELVRAINHLMITKADYGIYNLSNDGPSMSWADITRRIFSLLERNDLKVTDTTTEEYYKGKKNVALRPLQSTLNLSKIQATGFESNDWQNDLEQYIKKEMNK